MLSTHSITRRDWLILLFVVLIAAFMRFYRSDVVEYFHDDAMLSTLAQEMVTGVKFPLTGILSSTGIPNPPTSVYVMAMPFALSLDPQFAVYFVMALNVVGVGLLWAMAHRYFGRTVGLWAGLFYAVSPWAVYYSRKIWAQDFHTPFILLALLLGLYGFCEEKPRRWAQILCLPILLFGIQIHFAAWALLPLYPLILWMGRKNITVKSLLLSGVVSIMVLMPYAIGFFQTLQADPTRVSDAITREDDQPSKSTLTATALLAQDYLTLGMDYGIENQGIPCTSETLTINPTNCLPPTKIAEFSVIKIGFWLLGLGLLIVEFTKQVVTTVKTSGYRFILTLNVLDLFLILWLVLPVIALVAGWTRIYLHYFVGILPAFALITGIGIKWIGQIQIFKGQRQIALGIGITAILFGQVVYWNSALSAFDTYHVSYPRFTTPLHYLKTIENELHHYQDVVVVSQGMAWNLDHEVAVWDTLLKGDVQCVRTLKDGYFVQPAHPFAVLIAPNGSNQEIASLYKTASEQVFPTRLALEKGAFNGDTPVYPEQYVIYRHELAPKWTKTPIQALDATMFDNGVALIGYDVKDGLLVLRWHITREAPRGDDYQYSAQFFNANGERVGQQDARFWQGMHWCADDTLITYAPFELPSDTTEMRISMYQLGDQPNTFINANVLDAVGHPMGQQVMIPITP